MARLAALAAALVLLPAAVAQNAFGAGLIWLYDEATLAATTVRAPRGPPTATSGATSAAVETSPAPIARMKTRAVTITVGSTTAVIATTLVYKKNA
jgi:hypothetical protein